MAKIQVPITPAVLKWALAEAGLAAADAAVRLRVPEATLASWLRGESTPTITEYRRLGAVLHRPLATFLLSEPPAGSALAGVSFRSPVSTDRSALNTVERDLLRDVSRIQRVLSWAAREMAMGDVSLPKAAATKPPDTAAAKCRDLLESLAPDDFPANGSVAEAQAWWRASIEALGVMVFFLPVGEDSCRGFSVWDDYAPVIVVNTWWRPEARIFTMLHELGHLVTRSNSACLEQIGETRREPSDPVERWCEAFAARVLIPEPQLRQHLANKHNWDGSSHFSDLDVARAVARRFRVSTSAAVLRMISLGAASWSLFRAIPRSHDLKSGGGGGGGENRPARRIREYGRRTTQLFLQAIHADVLGRDDVLGYLRVRDHELDEMAA